MTTKPSNTSPEAQDPLTRVDLRKPSHLFAFGFGTGLAPVMPGTFGTLPAIPFIVLLAAVPLWAYVAVTLLAVVVGIGICQRASDDLRVHDHGAIVWDEVAGMMITLIAVPVTWQTLVAGFLLFRFFDILKPWPIKVIDRQVHGGLGIMLDDVLAGVFACIGLHLLLFFGVLSSGGLS